MNLPPEATAEFRQLYYQEHGVWLSDDDAHRIAHEFYTLGKTLIDMAQENEQRNPDDELPSPTKTRSK